MQTTSQSNKLEILNLYSKLCKKLKQFSNEEKNSNEDFEDISGSWIEKNEDLKSLEKEIELNNFKAEIEDRDFEMEFRVIIFYFNNIIKYKVLRRITET